MKGFVLPVAAAVVGVVAVGAAVCRSLLRQFVRQFLGVAGDWLLAGQQQLVCVVASRSPSRHNVVCCVFCLGNVHCAVVEDLLCYAGPMGPGE